MTKRQAKAVAYKQAGILILNKADACDLDDELSQNDDAKVRHEMRELGKRLSEHFQKPRGVLKPGAWL